MRFSATSEASLRQVLRGLDGVKYHQSRRSSSGWSVGCVERQAASLARFGAMRSVAPLAVIRFNACGSAGRALDPEVRPCSQGRLNRARVNERLTGLKTVACWGAVARDVGALRRAHGPSRAMGAF